MAQTKVQKTQYQLPEGTDILSTGEAGGTKFLREDGDGTSSWQAIAGGGDALVANPLSQFASTTSLQLKNTISDETGSGALVFATSPILVTPALGTPASGVATNLTGTASGLTAGNVTTNANLTGVVTSTGNATSIADAALSIAKTSGLQTALDAKAPIASPTFTGTVAGITATMVGLGNVDNTSNATERAATATLTNKRITKRTGTTTSSATPTIATDSVDEYYLTAQAADITSMTTNLSGTPTLGQTLYISIKGTAARSVTWGASFTNGAVALPTTTTTTLELMTMFKWNGTAWASMATGSTV